MKRVQDALEHREIERGLTIPRELEGPLDHAAVVAGDGKISASGKQGLEMLQVRAVDFTPRPVCDVGRFLVGPFHKSDPRTGRDETVDIFPSSSQTGLEAYPDAFVPLQEAFAKPDCVVRGVGGLHVQPEDAALGPRCVEDGKHLGQRKRSVDQQPELRRLEAHRPADPLGLHRGQETKVFAGRRFHLGAVLEAFSEVI